MLQKTLQKSIVRRSRWLFRSFIEGFCGNDPRLQRLLDVEGAVERLQNYLVDLPLGLFLSMYSVLLVIEFAIPPLAKKLRPMSWLSSEEKSAYLESWYSSRWHFKRLPMLGVKFLCVSQIYSDRKILDELGYGPAMRAREAGQCSSQAEI